MRICLSVAPLLVLAVAGVHGQAPPAFDPAETCEGKAVGAECWHQLESHPGCYVRNDGLESEQQTVSWTGACNGSVADGEGVLTWANPEGAIVYEGALVGGNRHGRGRMSFDSGVVWEGTFANGRRTGRWVERHENVVIEVPYVNDEIHGTLVARRTDGTVIEDPYANGERQGTRV